MLLLNNAEHASYSVYFRRIEGGTCRIARDVRLREFLALVADPRTVGRLGELGFGNRHGLRSRFQSLEIFVKKI
jgi:hypothetical protein